MSNKHLLIGALLSFVLMFSPFVLVFASWASAGFKGNIWSEGPGGHGAALWFMMLTIPAGGLALACVGVLWLWKWLRG